MLRQAALVETPGPFAFGQITFGQAGKRSIKFMAPLGRICQCAENDRFLQMDANPLSSHLKQPRLREENM